MSGFERALVDLSDPKRLKVGGKPHRRRARPEEQLHRAVLAHLRQRLAPPWIVAHIPNGGARTPAEAGALKAMGVLAGMPDLMLFGRFGDPPVYDGLGNAVLAPRAIGIELKAARGSLTGAQRDTIARLAACGIPTLVCRGIEEVCDGLTRLGVPLKGRVM